MKIPAKKAIERHPESRTDFSAELFRGMPKEEVDAVLASAASRKFESSEVIVHAGKPATRLFLIRTGRINYFRLTPEGRQISLGLLGPGDTFGLGTLVAEPFGYLGTAQAVTAGEAFAWTCGALCKLSTTCSNLSGNALRIVLGHRAMYANRLICLMSNTADQRLADTLVRFGRHFGRLVPGAVQVDIKNEQLASLADVNFFTASRLLKAWERSGAIKKGRGTVTILHPEELCFE